jgi:hypothetical protein
MKSQPYSDTLVDTNSAAQMEEVEEILDESKTETNNENEGEEETGADEQIITYEKGLQLIDYDWKNEDYVSYVVGTIKNNSDRNFSYVQVEIGLYDKSDARVGSTLDNINNLEPHGVWKFKAVVANPEEVERYKVQNITGF